MSEEMLAQVRERMLPMLRLVAEEYRPRVPEGYPIIVDSVANGVIGIEIDPSYALYITSDGKDFSPITMCARPESTRDPRPVARSSLGLLSTTVARSRRISPTCSCET